MFLYCTENRGVMLLVWARLFFALACTLEFYCPSSLTSRSVWREGACSVPLRERKRPASVPGRVLAFYLC